MQYSDFDLLGDPVDPHHGGRGRRQHVANDEKRRLVVMLCAFGRSIEEIAAALSVTPPTLRKHYKRQLISKERARMRAEALMLGALTKEVAAGNVTAIREMNRLFDRQDVTPPSPREEPLGKKMAAELAAKTAHEGNSWQDALKLTH